MNIKNLTKKIISIPSYVDENNNESQVALTIIDFIKAEIPWLKIYKQKIDKNRFNIIAVNSDDPKIVFISHMDTVPCAGDKKIRMKPRIENKRLYGLGAVDMKSGLAASLIAVRDAGQGYPVGLIFDCDEEYYFKGIKKIIQSIKLKERPFKNEWNPEIVIFPEPSNLQINYGCRGCIEIEFCVKGKTAHAGNPKEGINAIITGIDLVLKLEKILSRKEYQKIGITNINLSGISGGLNVEDSIQIRPNAIPDIAKIVLDIRTSDKRQTADFIFSQFDKIASKLKLQITDKKINLNLLPYITSQKKIKPFEKIFKKYIKSEIYQNDYTNTGYGEFALLGEKLNWNTMNFGPGPIAKAHQIDEFVNLNDLENTVKIFEEIIKFLGRNKK